jgi:hypothetical protein
MINCLITLINDQGEPTRVIPWSETFLPDNGVWFDPQEHAELRASMDADLKSELEEWERAAVEEAIKSERARRVEKGITITLPDYTGDIVLRGRDADREYMLGKMTAAGLMAQQGVTDPLVSFVDAANVVHSFTPAQFITLWSMAMTWVDTVYVAALDLRKMREIPENYAEDQWWPVS